MVYCEGAGNVYDDILRDVSVGGIDVGSFDVSNEKRDIFAEKKRQAWQKSVEARCNFERRVRLVRRSDVWFTSIWQKSVTGRTLTDIKADDSMVGVFAKNISELIIDMLGSSLSRGGWAVCTTPKRRHTVRNFATLISVEIAEALGEPFYEDVAMCRSRERVGAIFDLNVLPKEPNVIVFDDFVTTGQTLLAMRNLLYKYDKNLMFFTGINNIL